MATNPLPHATLVSSEWSLLQNCLNSPRPISVDGRSLTIPEVVAVCLYGVKPALTENLTLLYEVERSVNFLSQELQAGRTIYGVTTGFGGSADTRTRQFKDLQIALQQHLNVGILLPSDKGAAIESSGTAKGIIRSHALPTSIVKAMMLIRCNSLVRGHSGVRVSVIKLILTLLAKNLIPVVPLRGSISASGDLSSLSYISGVLEGNPDVIVRIDDAASSNGITSGTSGPVYMSAEKALKQAGLQPVRLQAKEGLSVTNGTAASCATACIVIHQGQQIAVLVQLLTAMGTEALLGNVGNYHPFIAAVRPHQGQVEAAANISAFLIGSKLAVDNDAKTVGLAQDRYALRTAPQWIGPQLEDLMLAYRQVQTEVNSTTDNPLIDVENNRIHHGGNFQAVSITSAMEKSTSAMQMLGKLLFVQNSELIDHKINKGLPPNLSADDPSLSFTFKGFDVNMAAYMSELAYLAHPVSGHSQISEMGNQSINSLALVAARYSLEAIEVVSLMAATYLCTLCQALDLRCLHIEFVKNAKPAISEIVHEVFQPIILPEVGNLDDLAEKSWKNLLEKWTNLSHLDCVERGRAAAKDSMGDFLEQLSQHNDKFINVQSKVHSTSTSGYPFSQTQKEPATVSFDMNLLSLIHEYQNRVGMTLSKVYQCTREVFFVHQTTMDYISTSSKIIYRFIRQELNVPMHRGLVDHPTFQPDERDRSDNDGTNGYEDREQRPERKKILGTLAGNIYMSVRDGRLQERVMEAWREVHPLN